jgi:hypothetical protein
VPKCSLWFMKFSCDFYSNQMAIGNAFNFVKTVLALKLYVRNISFILYIDGK